MSKRQQARNEKVLQDLVHNVPGNNFCADCQARNPCTCCSISSRSIPSVDLTGVYACGRSRRGASQTRALAMNHSLTKRLTLHSLGIMECRFAQTRFELGRAALTIDSSWVFFFACDAPPSTVNSAHIFLRSNH